MLTLKIITTVLIGVMMLIFMCIWISTAEKKEYTWVWFSIEAVYILSLFCIWG